MAFCILDSSMNIFVIDCGSLLHEALFPTLDLPALSPKPARKTCAYVAQGLCISTSYSNTDSRIWELKRLSWIDFNYTQASLCFSGILTNTFPV